MLTSLFTQDTNSGLLGESLCLLDQSTTRLPLYADLLAFYTTSVALSI